MLNLSHKFFGVSFETLDPAILPVCHAQLVQMRHKGQTVRNTELAWLRTAPRRLYRTMKSQFHHSWGLSRSDATALYISKFMKISHVYLWHAETLQTLQDDNQTHVWFLVLLTPNSDWRASVVTGTFAPLGDELSAWWELHNPTVAVTIWHEDGSSPGFHRHIGGLAEMILVAARLHAPSQN